MKKLLLIVFFLTVAQAAHALSPLPANAYLRIGDEQKEVLILQQILNSDPETLITKTGVGSPGRETWFFGSFNENALKRFQQKYSLEITGQIDFKTWTKINEYVASKNPKARTTSTATSTRTTNITSSTTEKNIFLNNTNNKYITNEENPPKVVDTKPATTTTKQPTYLDSLFSKYTGGLTPIRPVTNVPTNSFGSRSQFANSPQPNSNTRPPGQSSPGNFSQMFPFPGTARMGEENNAGFTKGNVGKIGRCLATTFAHSTYRQGCVADRIDQQNSQKSASGIVLSRPGVPAIPAVASWAGSFGDAVEVRHIETGKCKAFPLLERGPGTGPMARGVCIDLTGSAVDILLGNKPCETVTGLGTISYSLGQVEYAFIPGEKIKPGEVKDCSNLPNKK